MTTGAEVALAIREYTSADALADGLADFVADRLRAGTVPHQNLATFERVALFRRGRARA